jgi:Uma2 family endonuclease
MAGSQAATREIVQMTTAQAYPPRSIAPWAEVVPGYGPATVDLLLRLPDDGYIYEVVEGVLVRVAGSGKRATTLAAVLLAALLTFVRPRRLGVVTGADGVYHVPSAETGLLPDVGFYTAERDALAPDDDKPIPFAPDLAVEVASPSQDADDLAAKARVCLQGGTRLVWVIWPQSAHVDVWHAGVLTGPVAVLGKGDTLDGEEVVQGFSYPLSELFAHPLRQEP